MPEGWAGLTPKARTLLSILLVVLPIGLAGLLVLTLQRSVAVQMAQSVAAQSAANAARMLEVTAGAARGQLTGHADDPRLEQALDRGDHRTLTAILDELQAEPTWRGVAIVQDGRTIASAGTLLPEELQATPADASVVILERVGFQYPRAVFREPIETARGTQAILLGSRSLSIVEQAFLDASIPGMDLLLDPNGAILLGPPLGPGARLPIEPVNANSEVVFGDTRYQVAVAPVLGGAAWVASLRTPVEYGGRMDVPIAVLGMAALLAAGLVAVASDRLRKAETGLRRRERELAALQRLVSDSTATTAPDQILAMAGAQIAELLPGVDATWVAISLREGWVRLHPTYPQPGPPIDLPAAGNLPLLRVLQHGNREVGPVTRLDEAWQRSGLADHAWQSWTPLVAHGKVLGALALASSSWREDLVPDEVRLVDGLAATLAVALESWDRMAALAQERTVLATVVESSPDGILAYDGEDRVFLDNQAAREVLLSDRPLVGLRPAEIAALTRAQGGIEMQTDPSALVARAREGGIERSDFRVHHRGRVRSVELRAVPLPLPQGGGGSLLSLHDVSERAELEEVRRLNRRVSRLAAQASERAALLEQVLAASDLGLVFLDASGRVDYANTRFGDFLGVPTPRPGTREDELLELIWSRVIDGPAEFGEAAELETLAPEDRFLLLHTSEVRDQDGRLLGKLLSLRDETERRELDRTRESFIGIAAHELKNPLAVLRLKAEMGLRDPTKTQAALERILERSSQLQELVERLLDAARAELGKLTVDLVDAELLPWVRRAVEPFVEKASITVEGDPAVRAAIDPTRFEQVISNLVSNAVRYAGDRPILVEVEGSEDEARVAVRDQGPGIPLAEQATLFDRFAQGRAGARGPGLGIGLYLARRIVEEHGGRIDLESEPGAGSTFTVVLPRSPPEAAHPHPSEGMQVFA